MTVPGLLSDTLPGKAKPRTKWQSEMLIRRRVAVFRQQATEYELEVTIELVGSSANRADEVMQVPTPGCTPSSNRPRIRTSRHRQLSPPSQRVPRRTTSAPYTRTSSTGVEEDAAVRPTGAGVRHVTKTAVRDVLRWCQTCASIDPAPER